MCRGRKRLGRERRRLEGASTEGEKGCSCRLQLAERTAQNDEMAKGEGVGRTLGRRKYTHWQLVVPGPICVVHLRRFFDIAKQPHRDRCRHAHIGAAVRT